MIHLGYTRGHMGEMNAICFGRSDWCLYSWTDHLPDHPIPPLTSVFRIQIAYYRHPGNRSVPRAVALVMETPKAPYSNDKPKTVQ